MPPRKYCHCSPPCRTSMDHHRPKTSVPGARKSITEKIWEQGRRVSAATLRAGDKLISKAASSLTDGQKFAQCARLADVNELKLICADNQLFDSIITQFSITEQFGDVPFIIVDTENDLPIFKASLTQHEGFVLQDLMGDFIFSAELCEKDKSYQLAEGYQQRANLQPPVVGKVKNALGVTMYRLVQLTDDGRPPRSYKTCKPKDPQFYAVVKINEEKEYYVKIQSKKPFLYQLAKFFGLVMDSRVFNCTRSDNPVGKIRPKIGWNRNNIGYCLKYDQNCNNFTMKTVCLGFSMWAFLKFNPIQFPFTSLN